MPGPLFPTEIPAGFDLGQKVRESEVTPIQQVNNALQTAGLNSIQAQTLLTEDQVLQQYKAAQIDITDPHVINSAHLAGGLSSVDGQAAFLSQAIPQLQGEAPAPLSNYQQVLKQYGLTNYLFPNPGQESSLTELGGLKTGRGESAVQLRATKTKAYSLVNGVMYYRNGVVVDPNTGQLAYPPSAKVAGSPLWMNKVQSSWSAEQTENWRKQLYSLGYKIAKKGGWDDSLEAATSDYYASKYRHGGQVVPHASTPGGVAANTPLDLHQLSASIQNQVQQQYQSTFGQDPTPAELQSWTSMIINVGMQLQQGGKAESLSPDAALNEAEARAGRQITQGPTGKAAVEHAQENTALHDALSSAIAATRGLA